MRMRKMKINSPAHLSGHASSGPVSPQQTNEAHNIFSKKNARRGNKSLRKMLGPSTPSKGGMDMDHRGSISSGVSSANQSVASMASSTSLNSSCRSGVSVHSDEDLESQFVQQIDRLSRNHHPGDQLQNTKDQLHHALAVLQDDRTSLKKLRAAQAVLVTLSNRLQTWENEMLENKSGGAISVSPGGHSASGGKVRPL